MKLYHYSDKQHSELLTRRVQGADEKEIDIATFKAKRMGLPLPYHDHISLFFEPIPAEHIARTFLNGHPFWKAGNEIYEHVIDIQDIDPTSFWRVVESIEQTVILTLFNLLIQMYKYEGENSGHTLATIYVKKIFELKTKHIFYPLYHTEDLERHPTYHSFNSFITAI